MNTKLDSVFSRWHMIPVAPSLACTGRGTAVHEKAVVKKLWKRVDRFPVEVVLEVVGTPSLRTTNLVKC